MSHMEHLMGMLEIQFEQLHNAKVKLADKILHEHPQEDIEVAKWGVNAIKQQIEYFLRLHLLKNNQ